MTPLALSDSVVALWWIALGFLLVVAVVVWILLEVLRRTVVKIDEAVERVWLTGKELAQQTQTAHLLHTTKTRGVELVEELHRHGG
jgi:type II secretory pathway component PulF